ncbi:beta-glucan synthesis-associated protein-domain-containing protein [Amylocystis lapponica]|nr:beta-glucan synthesis-associated protein-domain-containing protein [Amylocystis lapponica]
MTSTRGGFVPYAFDPDLDSADTQDDDDFLHQPQSLDTRYCCSCRGIMNISMLPILVFSLLTLFIGYPFSLTTVEIASASLSRHPRLHQEPHRLRQPAVSAHEFNTDGRIFLTGDDSYWEAVDLWYGATSDQEWYDALAKQVTTSNGSLRILLDWNKLCFTGGYIDVAITGTLPGADSNMTGFWPGAWTMGNLAIDDVTAALGVPSKDLTAAIAGTIWEHVPPTTRYLVEESSSAASVDAEGVPGATASRGYRAIASAFEDSMDDPRSKMLSS